MTACCWKSSSPSRAEHRKTIAVRVTVCDPRPGHSHEAAHPTRCKGMKTVWCSCFFVRACHLEVVCPSAPTSFGIFNERHAGAQRSTAPSLQSNKRTANEKERKKDCAAWRLAAQGCAETNSRNRRQPFGQRPTKRRGQRLCRLAVARFAARGCQSRQCRERQPATSAGLSAGG